MVTAVVICLYSCSFYSMSLSSVSGISRSCSSSSSNEIMVVLTWLVLWYGQPILTVKVLLSVRFQRAQIGKQYPTVLKAKSFSIVYLIVLGLHVLIRKFMLLSECTLAHTCFSTTEIPCIPGTFSAYTYPGNYPPNTFQYFCFPKQNRPTCRKALATFFCAGTCNANEVQIGHDSSYYSFGQQDAICCTRTTSPTPQEQCGESKPTTKFTPRS